MGAKHSSEPRSVSMENPNPGVIDVSDDVVQRLKMGITKQAKENATASSKDAPSKEKDTHAPPPPKAAPTAPKAVPHTPRAPTIVYQNPAPVYVQTPTGTTMTALDVRRQKEVELQQNDTLWRQRMTQLEQTLNKTNTIMEKEYSSAVEDVRKRFATASPAHQLPPCTDLKAQIIACYRAHPGETLKCAEEVAMFRNCVSVNRVQKIDAETKTDAPVAAATAKAA